MRRRIDPLSDTGDMPTSWPMAVRCGWQWFLGLRVWHRTIDGEKAICGLELPRRAEYKQTVPEGAEICSDCDVDRQS